MEIHQDRIKRVFIGERGKTFREKQGESISGRVLDGQGCYLLPGMIDLHFHGCLGYDVCDATQEALEQIAKYELSIGVTSICPATMTLAVEELEKVLSNAAAFRQKQLEQEQREAVQQTRECQSGASLVGINMEGPFISKRKKGAQSEAYIIPCDIAVFHRFQKAAEGLVRFIGIAPEEGEAVPFIREAVKDKDTVVSLAHTNADYETAMLAFDAGASHVVHLYNGMSACTHREPGVAGAAAECEHVEAELICDGIHVHPAVVRNTFRLFGKERLILVSDSMRAAGMPDGVYTLGGQKVIVKGKRAELAADGALAGSVVTLPDCVRIAVKDMGIPLEDAVAAATVNPAGSLGIDRDYGSIEEGKKADLILWKEDLSLAGVIKHGRLLSQRK